MELSDARLKDDTLYKYNEVLNNNDKWEKGYWDNSIGKRRAIICTKHLCENILKFEDNDFEYRITKNMFIKHKLGNMLKKVYSDMPEKGVIDAFPEKEQLIIRQQKRKKIEEEISELIPKMFKNEDTRKEVAEKVISYLDCKEKDIPKNLSYFTISRLNIENVLKELYDGSVFKFIDEVRPGVFKPWEFEQGNIFYYSISLGRYNSKEVPRGYFENKDNRLEALIWILERLKEDGKKVWDLNVETIRDYGLITLMRYYKNSIFSMIDEFFHGKTKPWEFKEIGSKEYWNNHPDVAKEGVLLIVNKLGLTKDNMTELTLNDFQDNYLDYMLYINYKGLIFSAIDSLYPNEFTHLKWYFKDIPNEVFNTKENRVDAIRALVDKIGIKEEDIPLLLTREVLIDNGFDYILNDIYKGNIFFVINEAFPNKYSKNDFIGVSDEVEDYLDIFKNSKFSKLSFVNETKDDINEGLAKLGKVFTNNTNSWVGRGKPQPFVEQLGELEVFIYKELVKDNISIYVFEYEEPKKPNNKKEKDMYNTLVSHSKAKYSNLKWLYWSAYNFFKNFNLHLQFTDIYMGLGNKEYYNETRFYSYKENKEIDSTATIDKYKSIVRCGELDVYRLCYEALSDLDFAWVFPFDKSIHSENMDKNNENKSKAYLLQFTYDSKVKLNEIMRFGSSTL